MIPWPYLAGGACAYLVAGCGLVATVQPPRGLMKVDGSPRDRWGWLTWSCIGAAWPFFLTLWTFNTWRAGR